MVRRCVAINAVLPTVMSTCDRVIDVISIAPGEDLDLSSFSHKPFYNVTVQDFLFSVSFSSFLYFFCL